MHALNLAVDNVKLLLNSQYVRILPEVLEQEYDAALNEAILVDIGASTLSLLMVSLGCPNRSSFTRIMGPFFVLDLVLRN